jgi:hypothetical protein
MTAMFQTAREKTMEPDVVAATLLSAMAGVSRAMLEMGVTRGTMATTMEKELTVMVRAFLDSSAENVPAVRRPPLPIVSSFYERRGFRRDPAIHWAVPRWGFHLPAKSPS